MNENDNEEELEQELYTTESWDEAKQIAGLIGEVPSVFSTTLHFLRVDGRDNANALSENSRGTLDVLMKSDSFCAAILNAARAYRPVDSSEEAFQSRIELADTFAPSELQYIVSLLYLYRRIKKGCDPELFVPLAQDLIRDVELGGLIGTAIPAIGLPMSLLVTGFPLMGMAMFLGIDKKGFQKQKTRLKINNEEFNLSLEQERWKCNHLQVTALLLQNLSAGAKVFDPVVLGLSAQTLQDAEKTGLEDVYKAKLIKVWLESLLETGKAPVMTHRGDYYPLKDDLDVLEESAQKVREQGSLTGWLNANRYDLKENLFADEKGKDAAQKEDDLEELIEN